MRPSGMPPSNCRVDPLNFCFCSTQFLSLNVRKLPAVTNALIIYVCFYFIAGVAGPWWHIFGSDSILILVAIIAGIILCALFVCIIIIIIICVCKRRRARNKCKFDHFNLCFVELFYIVLFECLCFMKYPSR